jgi:YVTN family beta-propeller protein
VQGARPSGQADPIATAKGEILGVNYTSRFALLAVPITMLIKLTDRSVPTDAGLTPPLGKNAMNLRISRLLSIVAFALAAVLGSAQSLAQNAYITNFGGSSGNTVSVINTATDTVIGSPITVGTGPLGVAVTPDGSKVYVADFGGGVRGGGVSVIDTATNAVSTINDPGLRAPGGVAITRDGSKVYVTNQPGTVSVINTATNTVVGSPISVVTGPIGVAVTPDGSKVYVTSNFLDRQPNISVIDTATNAVFTITGIGRPVGVAVSPDGHNVYVADEIDNSVAVIDTLTNTVITTIPVGSNPFGVAVNPDGSNVYITNSSNIFAPGTVSVLDTSTNMVIGSPISVGTIPAGVAVTPDGLKVFVANEFDNTVSVIDTTTNMPIATIPVGNNPVALGIFIQPAPRFAGTPRHSNCHGQSVSALAGQYGGLNAAAAALGYADASALQSAIMAFCGG